MPDMFSIARTAGSAVHSVAPLNVEPPLERLRASFLTAPQDFYVRCHGEIPRLGEESHHLRVEGMVQTPLELSMSELKGRFPHHAVQATLQCAGNRRADMVPVRPVSGDPWSGGAIGNADWRGVRLAEILEAAGARRDAGLHVAFHSLDECDVEGAHFRYGASIPMEKALAPEVLLAFEMNGEKLAPEHGFPLRALVPGYCGARSPKWLAAITVQDHPSEAYPQSHDYKLFPPDVRKETADWDKGATINEMPVNSAICSPAPLAEVSAGPVEVRGWAYASGTGVSRVEVSADGGGSWTKARLWQDDSTSWSWTFWQAEMALAPGVRELIVRAWDKAGQVQPEAVEATWNFKGYLSDSWHRVRVSVEG